MQYIDTGSDRGIHKAWPEVRLLWRSGRSIAEVEVGPVADATRRDRSRPLRVHPSRRDLVQAVGLESLIILA